ncbi:MAG: PqqD family protein, partial [Candidatus Omnitrophica bacterium]|nr:PqqD family protein [Candidatus Omnitrophota bacterium]
MSQDKSVFKRKDGLSWRWENDQEIIIYRGGKFIWLNPVAAFIFYYCQGSSCAQIVELLGRGYRISEKLLLKHT